MKGNYLELFEVFWSHYPRKVKKKRALTTWMKIRPTDGLLMKMLDALEWQSVEWAKSDPRFTPHASTWLNDESWEDERPAPPKRKVPVLQAPEDDWAKEWKKKYDHMN